MGQKVQIMRCPFCGQKPYIRNRPVVKADGTAFELTAIKCPCGIATAFYNGKDKAVRTWHRRVEVAVNKG